MGTIKKKVAIMGMGYTGLTLAAVLAKNGFKVYGIDTKKDVIKKLRNGEFHFYEKQLKATIKIGQELGNFTFHESLPDKTFDVYIICVGTPIERESKTPKMSFVYNVIHDVGVHMKRDCLVVLRSTIPVGTSKDIVLPYLEELSGLKAGKDFSFVFAPERTIEGRAIIELEQNPQIIGGYDEKSVSLASDFFRYLTPTVVNVSNLESAEMIKILDNTYRDLRFAYANEIAMICEKLNLDTTELIRAANIHYPRNNIPVPSPGVGGACLSKDPHIFIDFAQQAGYEAKLIKESRRINEAVPAQIVQRIKEKLESYGKDIKSSKIFIVGFAFKGEPETSDLRDSTTLWFLEELRKYSKRESRNVYGYDPVVNKEHLEALDIGVCDNFFDGYILADVILFLNNHKSYLDLDPFEICSRMNKPAIFYDAWRMFEKDLFKNIEGINYMGVGM